MSQIEIPILNPLHFIPLVPGTPAKYKTKYYDDYLYADTLYDFQQEGYFFPVLLDIDTVKLQISVNIEPVTVQIIDCNGSVRYTQTMTTVRTNKYLPGFDLNEITIPLTGLAGIGIYFTLMAGTDVFRSEWYSVQSDTSKSILMEYSNSRYHGDVIFETGIVFSLRIPGMIENLAPGSLDKSFQDQILNNTLLSSKPFENINFWVGSEGGVPPWIIRKINWAQSCDTVFYDGKQYAKSDSSKWAEQGEDGLALKSYVIGLVPGINRASRIINPALDPSKKITLVYNLGGNVFGSIDSQGGTITTPVTGYE